MEPIEKYLSELREYTEAIKLNDPSTTAQSIGDKSYEFVRTHKNLDPRVKEFIETAYNSMFDKAQHKYDETKLEQFKTMVSTQTALVEMSYTNDQNLARIAHTETENLVGNPLFKNARAFHNAVEAHPNDPNNKEVKEARDKVLESKEVQQALNNNVTAKDSEGKPDEKKKEEALKKVGVDQEKLNKKEEKAPDILVSEYGNKVDLSTIGHNELSQQARGLGMILRAYANNYDATPKDKSTGTTEITNDDKLNIMQKAAEIGIKGLSIASFQGGKFDDPNTPKINEAKEGTFTAVINNIPYKIPVTFVGRDR